MKKLVTYMAFNMKFDEIFNDDLEPKKITAKIRNICPTAYILNIKIVSDEEAKNYLEFNVKEQQEKDKLNNSLNKISK